MISFVIQPWRSKHRTPTKTEFPNQFQSLVKPCRQPCLTIYLRSCTPHPDDFLPVKTTEPKYPSTFCCQNGWTITAKLSVSISKPTVKQIKHNQKRNNAQNKCLTLSDYLFLDYKSWQTGAWVTLYTRLKSLLSQTPTPDRSASRPDG